MKKTYISYIDGRACHARHNGEEEFALYTGVEPVEGEWILETAGAPVSLNSLEETGASELIDFINSIISDDSTPWENLSENDEAYIEDTLQEWGL